MKSIWTLIFLALATTAVFSGCKPDEETKAKLADHEAKVAENMKKISALEADLKKANSDISQLKDVVTKIGDVAVNLQRAEEARGKKGGATKAKPAAHAPAPKKPQPKKHH